MEKKVFDINEALLTLLANNALIWNVKNLGYNDTLFIIYSIHFTLQVNTEAALGSQAIDVFVLLSYKHIDKVFSW